MGSLWQGKTYPKNAASLLDRVCVNRQGLDLSKEVLWVSVGQRAAKIQAVKVGDLKKILPRGRIRTKRGRPGFESWMIRSSSKFDRPQLCSPLTYRDSQYLFWKISISSIDTNFVQKTGSIFKIGFALSMWSYFNSAYVLGVLTVFSATVCRIKVTLFT